MGLERSLAKHYRLFFATRNFPPFACLPRVYYLVAGVSFYPPPGFTSSANDSSEACTDEERVEARSYIPLLLVRGTFVFRLLFSLPDVPKYRYILATMVPELRQNTEEKRNEYKTNAETSTAMRLHKFYFVCVRLSFCLLARVSCCAPRFKRPLSSFPEFSSFMKALTGAFG